MLGKKKKKHRHHKKPNRLASDAQYSPSRELIVSCGTGSVFSTPTKDNIYGFVFQPSEELLSPEVAQNFLPGEDEVAYDPVTGKPLVRKAKLDMTDYELRYMDFIFKMIRRNGGVIDQEKIVNEWSNTVKNKKFSWLARSSDDSLFMWSSQKVEAAILLAKGVPVGEVAKRVGRPKYAIQHWNRHDVFKMEVARRKLELQEEYMEKRKLEARTIVDELYSKSKKYLMLIDHPHEKVSKKSLEVLRTILQEYRSFRDEERKDTGQATEIIKGTFDVLNHHRFTIDAIANRIDSREEREKFLTKAGDIAEEISENMAFNQYLDKGGSIDVDFEAVKD